MARYQFEGRREGARLTQGGDVHLRILVIKTGLGQQRGEAAAGSVRAEQQTFRYLGGRGRCSWTWPGAARGWIRPLGSASCRAERMRRGHHAEGAHAAPDGARPTPRPACRPSRVPPGRRSPCSWSQPGSITSCSRCSVGVVGHLRWTGSPRSTRPAGRVRWRGSPPDPAPTVRRARPTRSGGSRAAAGSCRPSRGPDARPVKVKPPASISSRSMAPVASTTVGPTALRRGGTAPGVDLVRAQPEGLLGNGVDERPLSDVVVGNGGEQRRAAPTATPGARPRGTPQAQREPDVVDEGPRPNRAARLAATSATPNRTSCSDSPSPSLSSSSKRGARRRAKPESGPGVPTLRPLSTVESRAPPGVRGP